MTDTLSTMGSETNQLSEKMFIVRNQAIIGEKLIKDFIKPGDCRILFDQQDLRQILDSYRQLCYLEFDDILYPQFDNVTESILGDLNQPCILALILINGGDKREIMNNLGNSILSKRGIQCCFAHSNTLEQSTSIRIYFFDKSQSENTSWRDRLNKVVEEVCSDFDL